MFDYFSVLARLHEMRRPRTYLEIGVFHGDSLRLVCPETLCIGVDPESQVPEDVARRCHLEQTTSDDFFAGPRVAELLGGRDIDMAFIDGLHLFEYALRDFMNVEAHTGPDSLIVIHDCLPRDARSAARERTTGLWTGDVWKLVLCLLDHRTDLALSLVDVAPSGLCFVERLDPGDTTLRADYEAIVEQYLPLTFADWVERWPNTASRLANAPLAAHRRTGGSSRQPRPGQGASALVWKVNGTLAMPRADLAPMPGPYAAARHSATDVIELTLTPGTIDRLADRFAADPPRRVLVLGDAGGSVVLFSELWRLERLVALVAAEAPSPALVDYIGRCDLADTIGLLHSADRSDATALAASASGAFDGAPIDLVVDDGSLELEGTRATFAALFPLLRPGGAYVLLGSHWLRYVDAWRDDGQSWRGKPATTLLALEMAMLSGSRPDLVAKVEVGGEFATIEKGDAESPGTELDLSAGYLAAGRVLLEEGLLRSFTDAGAAIGERDQKIAALHQEYEERSAWALDLDEQAKDCNRRLLALQAEYKERTAWALRLDDELAETRRELAGIKSTLTWRAYRTARHPVRTLHAVRMRRGRDDA